MLFKPITESIDDWSWILGRMWYIPGKFSYSKESLSQPLFIIMTNLKDKYKPDKFIHIKPKIIFK